MGRQGLGLRRPWQVLRCRGVERVERREFRHVLGWSVVGSWELEKRVEMLRMMEAVTRLRRLQLRVLVLVQPHAVGKYLPVVVTVVVEAQETTEKGSVPAKTTTAMASA